MTIDHVERDARRADAGHRRPRAADRPGRDHGRRRRPRWGRARRGSSSSRRSSTGRRSATPPAASACARRRACATRRGSAHDLPRFAVDRAARLIAEITGARVGARDRRQRPRAEAAPPGGGRASTRMRAAARHRARRRARRASCSSRSSSSVAGDGDAPRGRPCPSHRLDVTSSTADVAEEVARAHGYERIAGRLPQAALPPYRPDPSEPRHVVRRILAGLGLDEVVEPRAHRSGGPRARSGATRATPSSSGSSTRSARSTRSCARRCTPSRARRPGRERAAPAARRLALRPRQGLPVPPRAADAARARARRRREPVDTSRGSSASRWPATPRRRIAGEPARPADVADAQGHRRRAPRRARRATSGVPRGGRRGRRHPHRHPGRTGADRRRRRTRLRLARRGAPAGGRGLGPRRPPGRRGDRPRPAARARSRGARARAPIPSAQPVDRDLAVVVDDATPVGELLRIARTSGRAAARRPAPVRRLPRRADRPGRVSYALAFRFQPVEAGDEKDVEKALNRVRGSLQHHLGAEIR